MTPDIIKIIESRHSWKVMNDPVLKDLEQAKEIATKENDQATVATINEMIKHRKGEIE